MTLKEYAPLDAETREALARVGQAFDQDKIGAVALAVLNPEVAEKFASAGDAGEARGENAMAEIFRAVGEKIQEARATG